MFFRWSNPSFSRRDVAKRVVQDLVRDAKRDLSPAALSYLENRSLQYVEAAQSQGFTKREQIFWGEILGSAEYFKEFDMAYAGKVEKVSGHFWKVSTRYDTFVIYQEKDRNFQILSRTGLRVCKIDIHIRANTPALKHFILCLVMASLDYGGLQDDGSGRPNFLDAEKQESVGSFIHSVNKDEFTPTKALSLFVSAIPYFSTGHSMKDRIAHFVEKRDAQDLYFREYVPENLDSLSEPESRLFDQLATAVRETAQMSQTYKPTSYLFKTATFDLGLVGFSGTPKDIIEKYIPLMGRTSSDDLLSMLHTSGPPDGRPLWISIKGYTLFALSIFGELACETKGDTKDTSGTARQTFFFWTNTGCPLTKEEALVALPFDAAKSFPKKREYVVCYTTAVTRILTLSHWLFWEYRRKQTQLKRFPRKVTFVKDTRKLATAKEALNALLPFTSEDPARYYMSSVYYDMEHLVAVASDGHRLCSIPFDPATFREFEIFGEEIQDKADQGDNILLHVARPATIQNDEKRKAYQAYLKKKKKPYILLPYHNSSTTSTLVKRHDSILNDALNDLYSEVLKYFVIDEYVNFPSFQQIVNPKTLVTSYNPAKALEKKYGAIFSVALDRMGEIIESVELFKEIARTDAGRYVEAGQQVQVRIVRDAVFFAPAMALVSTESVGGEDLFSLGLSKERAFFSVSEEEVRNSLLYSFASESVLHFDNDIPDSDLSERRKKDKDKGKYQKIEVLGILLNLEYVKQAIKLGKIGERSGADASFIAQFTNTFSPITMYFSNGAVAVIMPVRPS